MHMGYMLKILQGIIDSMILKMRESLSKFAQGPGQDFTRSRTLSNSIGKI